jgi:hypothetical protein
MELKGGWWIRLAVYHCTVLPSEISFTSPTTLVAFLTMAAKQQNLVTASPIFKAMLRYNFQEGETLRIEWIRFLVRHIGESLS